MKKAAVAFAPLFLLAALATANAKTYSVTLSQPTVVAGTELKAGTYHVDVMDSSIVIKGGKAPITVPAKLEKNDTRFPANSVRYEISNGKRELKQIRFGNTNLRVVLGVGEPGAATATGEAIH